MDTLSHGLYGGIAFGRKSKVSYWKAFFFGIMPDIFSFGIFTASTVLGLVSGPDWNAGPPDPSSVPQYVHSLYDVTHSLVVVAVVFGIVWWVRKKPMMELLAWPLHILVDMPTHSSAFFPTPFLWPVSDFTINGISWGTPWIFIPNVILIVVLYLVWYVRTRRRKQNVD
jgi:hypothetical protein